MSHQAATTSQLWLCSCLLQLGGTYWSVQVEVPGLHVKADFIRPPQSGVGALCAPGSLPCVCSSGRKEAKMELKALGRLSLASWWVLCPGRCHPLFCIHMNADSREKFQSKTQLKSLQRFHFPCICTAIWHLKLLLSLHDHAFCTAASSLPRRMALRKLL